MTTDIFMVRLKKVAFHVTIFKKMNYWKALALQKSLCFVDFLVWFGLFWLSNVLVRTYFELSVVLNNNGLDIYLL